MKSKAASAARILIRGLVTAVIFLPIVQATPESNPMPASSGRSGIQDAQVTLPTASAQGTLRLLAGRSMVVSSAETLKRVSVTNDEIAMAIVVAPNQVLIHGIKPGKVTLLLWNELEQIKPFDLEVQLAPIDLENLRTTLSRVLPGEKIQVSQSGSSVVLTGTVSTAAAAEQAVSIVKTESANVVNLLGTVPMTQIVMLEVKFAEVDRNAAQQLGINIISTGALNTPGAITTGQFSPASAKNVGGGSTDFSFSDLLNIFVFRPDLNLALTIKALQQRSLLQILAEPNLLALGGKEASFLAGGEFPIPVVQGGGGTNAVSVQFREFGVRLKFTANPNPDGVINLKVAPEVSSLDYSNAVTLSGFLIPALATRKAETEVQLSDGQSFAIAGLMDNRITKVSNKIPWLGDVPFLGNLFKSQDFKKSRTELLVMVTPRLVKPLAAGQAPPLPEFPIPFIKSDDFDGKKSEDPAAKKK